MKINNAIRYKGKTYTRTGRSYSHAVVMTSKASKAPLVEWASSQDLAMKNRNAHQGRINRVAKGESLGGVYSTDYYRQVTDLVVVEVEHPATALAGAKAAGRTANRADDAQIVEDAPIEPAAAAVDDDAEAKRRERWAANKRASRARLKKTPAA